MELKYRFLFLEVLVVEAEVLEIHLQGMVEMEEVGTDI
jgi:hypothetical protein